ncbi:MAG: DUF4252 domain-containing protein [Flavobacterium sp.]|nr:DUF4252 domain-containing protein [Flavobacterium sp.]MDI1316145.1 DUF4252 domain-containing protein [Flavobacterium sp.]
MNKVALYTALLVSLFLTGCNSKPTIQSYFVENSDKKDFIVLDVAPSIINIDKTKLSAEQKTALASFDKMNVLAFKLDKTNKAQFETESNKVKEILKGKEYQELMKYGSGKDAASISFVGDENNISEFILYGKKEDNGFAVVRILGKDMNPNNIMNILSILKSSNIDMEQLKPLQAIMK